MHIINSNCNALCRQRGISGNISPAEEEDAHDEEDDKSRHLHLCELIKRFAIKRVAAAIFSDFAEDHLISRVQR